MKGQSLRTSILLAVLVLSFGRGNAFQQPLGTNRLDDFDGRISKRAEPVAASIEQKAAAVELVSRMPKARVDFDPVTSSPRMVSVQNGFLTQSTEQSQALAVGAPAPVLINDSNKPIRVFLEEQRNLFGHGPEVLDQARVARDYVTKHNGMRTVVWQQEVDGIPVFESMLVAHTTKRGELINVSSGFVPDPVAAADAGTSNRAAWWQLHR